MWYILDMIIAIAMILSYFNGKENCRSRDKLDDPPRMYALVNDSMVC